MFDLRKSIKKGEVITAFIKNIIIKKLKPFVKIQLKNK